MTRPLLEVVNAGLLPVVIVDNHKAGFWAQIFERIQARDDLAVRTGGEIAWASRQDTPKLKQLIDAFVCGYHQGPLQGKMVLKRYLKDTREDAGCLELVRLWRPHSGTESVARDLVFSLESRSRRSENEVACRSAVGGPERAKAGRGRAEGGRRGGRDGR